MTPETTSASSAGRRTERTFIVYLEDRPGTLNRVVSLFRRRGFNIDSLTVGRTERPGVSRLTLVVQLDDDASRRLEAHLYNLVNVLYVEDVTHHASLARELALVKVKVSAEKRGELLAVCETFRARVVDVGPGSLIVELTGSPDELSGGLEVLRPYGILELLRTGTVAMTRGASAPAALGAALGGGVEANEVAA